MLRDNLVRCLAHSHLPLLRNRTYIVFTSESGPCVIDAWAVRPVARGRNAYMCGLDLGIICR